MKKKALGAKLSLQKKTISNLDIDAIKGKGPETWTCNCITRVPGCVIYQPTMDGCASVICTGSWCF